MEDVLVKIMELLPAKALAAATCVSLLWSAAAKIVKQRPRVVSAISVRGQLKDAVNEVTMKVLESPFRPQFAIVFASPSFSLRTISAMLRATLPDDIPVIGCHTAGIIGVDAATNEYKEVFFDSRRSAGVSLISGSLPGVRVESLVVPDVSAMSYVARLVDTAPKAFIFLSKRLSQMSNFFEKLGASLPMAGGRRTAVAGGCCVGDRKCLLAHCNRSSPYLDEGSVDLTNGRRKKTSTTHNLHSSKYPRRSLRSSLKSVGETIVCLEQDIVGLIITEDCQQCLSVEVCSAGAVIPVGPVYTVASAYKMSNGAGTRFSCRIKGANPLTPGLAPLFDIVSCRKLSSPMQNLVTWADSKYVEVEGNGYKRGDDIMFYNVEKAAALASRDLKFDEIETLTQKKKLLWSLIFACEAREPDFFGEAETDGYHFGNRFGDVPKAGMFCTAEIGPNPDKNEALGLHSHTSMFSVFAWQEEAT